LAFRQQTLPLSLRFSYCGQLAGKAAMLVNSGDCCENPLRAVSAIPRIFYESCSNTRRKLVETNEKERSELRSFRLSAIRRN
jgi:hypothetical protein